MAQTAAVGDGPIVFFTDEGQEVSYPLTGAWDLTVPQSDPSSKLAPPAFAVTIEEPAPGAGLKLPAPGTFTLWGGADVRPPAAASVTFLAGA